MYMYALKSGCTFAYSSHVNTRVEANKWQMPNLINDFSIRKLILELLLAIYYNI